MSGDHTSTLAKSLLRPVRRSATPGVGVGPERAIFQDFDGDGDADLAVPNYNSATLSILLNDSTGTFSTAATMPMGSELHIPTAGDFDGDGDLDLTITSAGTGLVIILSNDGQGAFTQTTSVLLSGRPSPPAAP